MHHLTKTSSSCSTTVFIKCRRPPGTEVHYGIPPRPRSRMGPTFPSGGASHSGDSLSPHLENLRSVRCVVSGRGVSVPTAQRSSITDGIHPSAREGKKERGGVSEAGMEQLFPASKTPLGRVVLHHHGSLS